MRKIIALCLLTLASLTAFATTPTSNTIAPMLKKVMPGVVNVRATGEIDLPNILRFGPSRSNKPLKKKVQSAGSGVIIDAQKGYILTNAHVLKYAKDITVTLSNEQIYKAKLIGKDDASDIAVLRIKAQGLTSVPLGDSDNLEPGDFVAAIGSPYGLSQTVTSGIVSALERNNLRIEGYENFIQTDAAINPGNSGGALVTFDGKLIGINTAIISPMGGNVGIGFAIPINMAETIMDQLIKYGEVRRGLLGIFAQPLTPDLRSSFGLKNNQQGTVITSVAPESPAADAGLKVGDVILSINGKKVTSPYAIRNVIGLLRVNSKIKLSVLRSGEVLKKTAVITAAKTQQKEKEEKQPFLYGLSLRDGDNIESALHGTIKGIQVLNVSTNSPAATAGLLPGDFIISANQKTVGNIKQLQQAIKLNKKSLLLNIIRGPGALFIVIK